MIGLFLESYRIEPDGRALDHAERQLVDDAHVDLTHEQWLAPEREEVALDVLASDLLLRLAPCATTTLRTAAATLTDIAARLARSDHANLILREQLAIRSDPRCRAEREHGRATPDFPTQETTHGPEPT